MAMSAPKAAPDDQTRDRKDDPEQQPLYRADAEQGWFDQRRKAAESIRGDEGEPITLKARRHSDCD
jgi:hypothetical protein